MGDDYDATASEPQAFDRGRRADWRDHVDARGVPTCGPERATDSGCHYCAGPLDASPETGTYVCPWCIARFPEAEPTHARLTASPKNFELLLFRTRDGLWQVRVEGLPTAARWYTPAMDDPEQALQAAGRWIALELRARAET